MTLLRLACLALLLCSAPLGAAGPPARRIDFGRDIRPILKRACVSCHDAEHRRGGLRLDSRAAALRGGDSGIVIRPRHADTSRLYRLIAGLDPEQKMPPGKRPALSPREVALVRAWIDQGAHWPASETVGATGRRRSAHWSFQPVRRPALPAVRKRSWLRNPLDAFLLALLEKERLAPSPEADRVTLLRRLSFDLIGLPPTPAEVDAFLADRRPGAYERQVDRLLASPHYGERWGRHWLDVARYADSDGYEKDSGRPFAWRYRHWVIAAFNRDLPYDRFTIEQLAGDLLPGASIEQKVATGFHRNTLTNREGGVDREQFRVEAVLDRVNTTARVFLGLTLGCAQCHDHKYDPLSQRDYYRFFAFFNSDVEIDISAPLLGERPQPAPPPVRGKKKRNAGPTGTLAQTLALGRLRKTHVLIRGDFLRKGVQVEPGTPAVLSARRAPGVSPARATRLHLAGWIADPKNPLTARVAVNWVWQKFFGRGLVATPEDFGTQGEKPSHPELLDYLASELVRHRWSLKAVQRLIVTSAGYRQRSALSPGLRRRDPRNVLLARQTRQRLDAEVIRDSALAASGLLLRRIGGPSVRPAQPAGISELTYAGSARWIVSKGPERHRRGLYIWFQRTSPFPMLMTFDAPDSNLCCVRRERTNTPLQALTLLNDTNFVEYAGALGRRAAREKSGTAARLRYIFRLCLARSPTAPELARLERLYAELHELSREDPKGAAKLAGKGWPAGVGAAEGAAWVAVARTVLNLDEFVMRE